MKSLILCAAAIAVATPVYAESWTAFSRSRTSVYLADVESISSADDITSMRVALVPKEAPAGDFSYTAETYQVQCLGGKWRAVGITEYDRAGVETGDFPDPNAAWDDINPQSMSGFIKAVACDSSRGNATFPTVQAFIEAGRP